MVKGGPKTWDVTVGPNGSLSFSPDPITISAGDTVKWTWANGGHNVVSGVNRVADNKFCSPNDMNCNVAPTSNAGAIFSCTARKRLIAVKRPSAPPFEAVISAAKAAAI